MLIIKGGGIWCFLFLFTIIQLIYKSSETITGNYCGLNDLNFCSSHGSCYMTECFQSGICENVASAGDLCAVGHFCTAKVNDGTCCSGRCFCDQGWAVDGTLNSCLSPLCSGIKAFFPGSCSDHGDCIAPDTCDCDSQFTGANCESCILGFSGPSCNTPVCCGLNATNIVVCSGHGDCIAPDTCSCSSGFIGDNCEVPFIEESPCVEKTFTDEDVFNWRWIAGSNSTNPPSVSTNPDAVASYGLVSCGENGLLWKYGGFDQNVNVDTLWTFNTETRIWTKITYIGTPGFRSSHGMVCIDNKEIWVFGGFGLTENSFSSNNDLWKYVLSSNTWTEIFPNGTLPMARNNFGMTQTNGTIYVYGGDLPTSTAADLWGYDTKSTSNQWVIINSALTIPNPDMLVGTKLTSLEHSDQLYLFGGSMTASFPIVFSNQLWCFNISSKNWIEIISDTSPPPGRNKHGFIQIDRELYVGFGGDDSDNKILNDIWKYDLDIDLWQLLNGKPLVSNLSPIRGTKNVFDEKNTPGSRGNSIEFANDGNLFLYMFGGSTDSTFNEFYNDMWELKIGTKIICFNCSNIPIPPTQNITCPSDLTGNLTDCLNALNQTCPDGQFKNETTGECQNPVICPEKIPFCNPGDENSLTCVISSECASLGEPCSEVPNGVCTKVGNFPFFSIACCGECIEPCPSDLSSNLTECLNKTCPQGFFKNEEGDCEQVCPDGFFKNEEGICVLPINETICPADLSTNLTECLNRTCVLPCGPNEICTFRFHDHGKVKATCICAPGFKRGHRNKNEEDDDRRNINDDGDDNGHDHDGQDDDKKKLCIPDTNICYGHGNKNHEGKCMCYDGYVGYNCESPYCSPHCDYIKEICTVDEYNNNICKCKDDYIRYQCDDPKLKSNYKELYCNQYKTSICIKNYKNIVRCNGIPSSSENVCNSRGNCVSKNTCECNECKYHGNNCESEYNYLWQLAFC